MTNKRRPETGVRSLTIAVVVLVGTMSGCVRQVRTSNPIAQSGVTQTMGKQIQNAIDAGDGDMEARAMRQRLAANPEDLDARLVLARRYLQRGFPDLALEHYRLAAARFPDSAPVALGIAKTLRELSQQQQALESLEAFLGGSRKATWDLLSLQGILLDERGRYAEAETAHRAALALDLNRSALHNNLGYNLTLQGKRTDAAAEFRRALELDANSEFAKNNLAVLEATGVKSAPEPVNFWKRITSTLSKAVMGPSESTGGAADGAKK